MPLSADSSRNVGEAKECSLGGPTEVGDCRTSLRRDGASLRGSVELENIDAFQGKALPVAPPREDIVRGPCSPDGVVGCDPPE